MPEFVPADSPFDEEQRNFLNGLFAGVYAVSDGAKDTALTQTPLKILVGSQTGTAESLARALRKYAGPKGFDASIAVLDDIDPTDLAALDHILIIAATHGEGEPTDNAKRFYTKLMADDMPALPATLNFSVCGLGDSSYAHFNKMARDLDARLAELGATRAASLVTCDLDYDADYACWRDEVFDASTFKKAAGVAAATPVEADSQQPAFDKSHPFIATLIDCKCLSGAGSAKAVNHVEIALTGGGEDLQYAAGDGLGIWPLNDMTEVDAILDTLGFSGRETVSLKTGATSLRLALYRALDLTTVTQKAADAWQIDLDGGMQLIDVLKTRPAGLTAQNLVDGLRTLQPRVYSISSSPNRHPGEVHLTVREVRYALHGTSRKGVASTYLGSRLKSGNALGVYVQRSSHFHLPENDETPLIMIGPGTGIAPFRAFLEEREFREASGSNWLFFGDQHQSTDYLYAQQLESWHAAGFLNRLSLAWSRDSEEKIYVHDLIERDGAEFFEWLDNGAAVYVCGDATRMAADVEQALLRVIAEHGRMDVPAAERYLDELRKARRYQRDVY